jgi:hypothetical protein
MLKKVFVSFVFLICLAISASAQEVASAITGYIFDCDAVNTVLEVAQSGDNDEVVELLDTVIATNASGDDVTVAAFLGEVTLKFYNADQNDLTIETIFDDFAGCNSEEVVATPDLNFERFNIVANTGVNIRSCAGTNCDVVRLTGNDEIFEVTGSEGDWYQISVDGGIGFISASLTTRGPNAVIRDIEEGFEDRETGCSIVASVNRGDADVQFIIYGEDRNDTLVDIIRPSDANPLRVEGQFDKTFTDTGEPYIQQYYRFNVSWPAGIYTIQIQYEGETRLYAWDKPDQGDFLIYVACE